jgi:aminoglycoside phosphotransferase family enzyme
MLNSTALEFGAIDRSPPSLSEVLDALGIGPDGKIVETPSSWVILAERHAYKLQRSVDEDSAAGSSPELRRIWCAEEQWRNERLAPGVYLGILALARGRDGALRMGGKGVPVEWVVKMRRLRAENNLKVLIRQREICRGQVIGLARTLTAFYQAGPPQHDQVDALITRLQRRINEATKTLMDYVPAREKIALRRLRDVQWAFLLSARADLNKRVCDGRIVDGHGELLPEHIFLDREPSIIGAIAHAAEPPKLDAIDDLGLLAMECERLGRDDIAKEIMAAYRNATFDVESPSLWAFYMSLHACNRAATRITQPQKLQKAQTEIDLTETLNYLKHAVIYAKHAKGRL